MGLKKLPLLSRIVLKLMSVVLLKLGSGAIALGSEDRSTTAAINEVQNDPQNTGAFNTFNWKCSVGVKTETCENQR